MNVKAKIYAKTILPPVIAVVMLFVIWQLWIVVGEIPSWKVPGPIVIWKEMITNFTDYVPDILYTYSNIIIGFILAAVVGIVLAALMSNFAVVGTAFMPLMIFISMIPMITIIPMLMLWIGFGRSTKLIAIVLQSFPIIMLNAMVAFMKVDSQRLELMQSLKASKWQTFRHCTFPNALPGVFAGLRLGAIMSSIAAVTAEISGGNQGLGVAVNNDIAFASTIPGFSCMMFIIIFGMVFYMLVSLVEKLVVKN